MVAEEQRNARTIRVKGMRIYIERPNTLVKQFWDYGEEHEDVGSSIDQCHIHG